MDISTPKIHPGSVCSVPYALAGFGGTLVSDFAHGVPCARQFFPARGWRDAMDEISTHTYPRAALAKTLEDASRTLGAPEASLTNARRLADANTYVVATGQQAGFLGGPLLTIYKALTAVKLARQFETEAAGSARFVPVFWVAGDDHDLAEIDHAYFLREDAQITRAGASVGDAQKGRSSSDVFLTGGADFETHLKAEIGALVGAEFLDEALREYAAKSFESVFVALLLKWLGPTGLVVARSSDLRQYGAALFVQDLEDFDIVSRLIQEAGVAMTTCAYEPGFSEKLRSAPHFFMAEKPGAKRGAIVPEMRGLERVFRVRGEADRVLTRDELREKITREPGLFTASAPLRPILQQMIFPVVAAVLGPGEMAYWAQLRQVHAHYGAVWPAIVPRASLTILDGLGEKAVRKLGLTGTPNELFLSHEELARKASDGGELGAQIASHTRAILAEFDALRATIQRADSGMDPMLDKLRQKFEFELARVAEKTGAALDKRGDAKAGRVAYLSALVRPRNAPQERVLCCAQFMATFPNLVERLLAVIEPERREHLVVTM